MQMILNPARAISLAAMPPTLPNPWITTRVAERSRPKRRSAWSMTIMHPRPVASVRPRDPPRSIGLPVTTPSRYGRRASSRCP